MEWRSGDMVDVCRETNADGIVFTANSVVTKSGELVMGAGAAKRVQNCFPNSLAKALGAQILKDVSVQVQPDYHLAGVVFKQKSNPDLPFYIFALQVKRDFRLPGDLKLTIASLGSLVNWCEEHPNTRLVMNCPLIGLGGFAAQKEEIVNLVSETLAKTSVIVTIM